MTYRLYFHKRNGNDPVVWSIDEGTQETEMHIRWFRLERCAGYSMVDLDAKDGEPSGWIQVDNAFATIALGGAVLTSVV